MRILGRYRGLPDDKSIGVQFGLKLATGSFHNNFVSGPQEGEPLDRGLQPGTGTTDLLLGAYNFGAVNRDWDYFAAGDPAAASQHTRGLSVRAPGST